MIWKLLISQILYAKLSQKENPTLIQSFENLPQHYPYPLTQVQSYRKISSRQLTLRWQFVKNASSVFV